MTTIYDIAKQAGVSHNTVARVLNGAQYIRPTYRKRAEKIRKIADDLGYRPNTSARAIGEGKFRAITLLLSTDRSRSSLSQGMLYGIQSAAAKNALSVNLSIVEDGQLEDENFVPKALGEWHSDGILINYHKTPPARLQNLLDKYQLPAVWLNYETEHDSVRPDDYRASRDATQELIDAGHRRIEYVCYIYRKENTHHSELARRDGYAAAMIDARLKPVCIDRYRDVNPDYSHSLDRWTLRMKSADRPTAILAYSHTELTLLVTAAKAAGLDVPRDLSFVTFGEHPIFSAINIDTWVTPDEAVGRRGLEMLMTKIAQPDAALTCALLPFTRKRGESFAPVRDVSSCL